MATTNPIPTWLRAFRVAAFGAALIQLLYGFYPFPPAFAISWIFVIGLPPYYSYALVLYIASLGVRPSYAVLVFVTYRLSENLLGVWANYMAGVGGPFLAWPTEIKFMVIYATLEGLFLVAQVFVLPFYLFLSNRPTQSADFAPA